MGWIGAPFRAFTTIVSNFVPTPSSASASVRTSTLTPPGSGYAAYARAYSTNELVYASIKLLSTSAAEPHIIGRRNRQERSKIRAQTDMWRNLGISNRAGARRLDALLVQNKYVEEVTDHPLIKLLNNPNPFTSRGQLWSMIVTDRYLAGNAYLLKGRNTLLGNTQELWRLRPDRVRIIPDREKHIAGYEYKVGNDAVVFPAEDVIHFKEATVIDDYYGMPPLMPIMGRISIDDYMKRFLHTFFEKGGTGPGSILTVKSTLPQEAKDEIRDRFKRTFSGNAGFHEMLILDNTDSTYTQMGLDRGLRDALPKEVDAQVEARILMAFGIPGSIIGALIGYESSSYANKRQDWQVLWDVTMTPLLSDLDDVLNLTLVPEFSGVDEVAFDLSDIRALQEDEDALQERARKNVQAGLWLREEGRVATGVEPYPDEGSYMLPGGSQIVTVESLGKEVEAGGEDVQAAALNGAQIASLLAVIAEVTAGRLSPEAAKLMIKASFPSLDDAEVARMVDSAANFEPKTPPEGDDPPASPPEPATNLLAGVSEGIARAGRGRLANDPQARALWERGEALRAQHPRMTIEQVAGRVGVSESTYHRYRRTFTP